MTDRGNEGTFTLTVPDWDPLPRRWWQRALRRPVRYKSVPHVTPALPYGASADEVQAALNLPNTQVVKQADGTYVLTFVGAADEVSA